MISAKNGHYSNIFCFNINIVAPAGSTEHRTYKSKYNRNDKQNISDKVQFVVQVIPPLWNFHLNNLSDFFND